MKHRQQLSQCNMYSVLLDHLCINRQNTVFIKLEYLSEMFEMMYFYEWSTDIHHRFIVLHRFFIAGKLYEILEIASLSRFFEALQKSIDFTTCESMFCLG